MQRILQARKRKSLLLSHHPLFSARNDNGAALRTTMAPVLESVGGVDSWFWAHEHRHAEYDERQGVRHPRLLGHGGVPVYMWRGADSTPVGAERWEYRDRLPGHVEPWALFGFAVLDFRSDAAISVRYVNEFGSVYRSELIA